MGWILAGVVASVVGLVLYRRQQVDAGTGTGFLDLTGDLQQLPVVGKYFVSMDSVKAIARAIAFAEGFYVAGSRAARNHNPGDLTADIGGNDIHPLSFDGPFAVYASDADGFADLEQQILKWLTGSSQVAGPGDTIASLATKYTATEQTGWASNVASYLGVPADTKLQDLA